MNTSTVMISQFIDVFKAQMLSDFWEVFNKAFLVVTLIFCAITVTKIIFHLIQIHTDNEMFRSMPGSYEGAEDGERHPNSDWPKGN
jgi:hypothetical protein